MIGEKEFRPIPTIDAHFHQIGGDVRNTSIIHNMAKIMGDCGIKAVNVASLTAVAMQNERFFLSDSKRHEVENLIAVLCKAFYPEHTYAFGGLHYQPGGLFGDASDLGRQAHRLANMGFDGIKMIEGKPTVRKALGHPLDSPIYNDLYRFAEEQSIPMIIHVNDPLDLWHPGGFYSDGSYPSSERTLGEMESVLESFPNLRVILAHFCFLAHDIVLAERFLEKHANASFDFTPGPDMYLNFSKDTERWRAFFIKHQDRLIFGTDNHGEPRVFGPDAPQEYLPVPKVRAMKTFFETDREFVGWHQTLRGVCLPDDVLKKIYHDNFIGLVGNDPKRLDTGCVIDYCRELLSKGGNLTGVADVMEQVQFVLNTLLKLG